MSSSTLRQQTQKKFGPDRLLALIEAKSKAAKLTARQIAEQIRKEHPEVLIVGLDVFFFQRKLRLGAYHAGTSTQAFVELLSEDDRIFHHAIDRSPTGKTWRVFWKYKSCIQDWKNEPRRCYP